MNSRVDGYTKTQNHQKILRKPQKITIYWNQKNTITEI